jgi:murein DD-endopeptidase MepM/ murein hydrolase activator NlpD
MTRTDGTIKPAGKFLLLAAVAAAASLLAAPGAHADIYRYVNDDGVECFTDAPISGNATRILRENTVRQRTAPSRTASRMKAATETAQKSVTLLPDKVSAEEIGTIPVQGVLTSLTGLRIDPIDGMLRLHQGVDIAIPEGTPVKPVAAGIVVFSGWRAGYGNTVVVQHGDGMTTLYGHNRLNLAKRGDAVSRETAIAFSGSTGRSTGPHLHFEAWKDGVNLTESFIPAGYPRTAIARASHYHHDNGVRRIPQSDGSILFTNLR